MKNFLKQIVVFILELEAKLVVKRYNPKIVAITGSVGKTSTKDAVYAVLSKFFFVRKSDKSFNSEIGLPLTILGCENGWSDPSIWVKNILKGLALIIWKHEYPEWLVLEIGAGKPGDIKDVAKWLRADVVIITRFGETPVHVEFFRSIEHLIEEKSSLVNALKKDGVLILNADDDRVLELKSHSKSRVATYSFEKEATISGSNRQAIYSGDENGNSRPIGISFKANFSGNSLPVIIEGALGVNHVYAALAALSVAHELNLNMITAIASLRNYDLPPGRMRAIEGVEESMIIDDSYNASPVAVSAALSVLREMEKAKRKIVVFGDMLELGKFAEDAHRSIGRQAYEVSDILVTVGMRAKFAHDEALSLGMKERSAMHFNSATEAGDFLKEFIKKGDIILVKGSQGMRMERLIAHIMARPDERSRILSRQEKEWLAKQ